MISPRAKTIAYSDFRTGFDAHPITGDLVLVYNEDSVIQSLRNIMQTSTYERPGNTQVGGGVRGTLFELPSAITEDALLKNITYAVRNQERRVDQLRVSVSFRPDLNSYSVTLIFTVANNDTPITFTHLLERLR